MSDAAPTHVARQSKASHPPGQGVWMRRRKKEGGGKKE